MKAKKILSSLLTTICFSFSALAISSCGEVGSSEPISDSSDTNYQATEGLEYALSEDGNSYSITGITTTERDIVIPAIYNNKPVTSIAESAFWSCTFIRSIRVPDSVTSIGFEAFRECSGLQSITLPFIGETLDGTENTHFGYIFGASHSYDNNSFIPTKLNEVTITKGKIIGVQAFYDCSSLTSIKIPNGVTEISWNAFRKCSSLTSFTIPDSVTSIGEYAFASCSLTSITIPNSVTSIDNNAFSGCGSLESVKIGKGVTRLEGYTFAWCSSLTSITIPDNVTRIGERAFLDCTLLTSITIPDSLISVDDSAFCYCSSLETVYYTGTEEQWNNINISWYCNEDFTGATIVYNYVPEE